MEVPGKLSIDERYRRAIEALMRFDFHQREGDLQWMLAESRKPVKGLSWLKEKYYELLGKCEAYPVPFQLIYDLETIAGRIFPKAARKFAFLRDPIREYFKTRMRQYDAEIRQLLNADEFHLTDLLPLIGTMNQRDGRSMVSMFLSSLKDGKIHKALAARAGPEVQKVIDAIADLPLTDQLEDLSALGAALSRADAVLEAEQEDRPSFSAHASSPESSRDSFLDTGEAAFAGEKVEDFAASVDSGEDYRSDGDTDLDAKQELDEAASEPLGAGDQALAVDSFSPGRDEYIGAAVPVDPSGELSVELPIDPPEEHSAEPPGHKPGYESGEFRTPLPVEQSGAFQAGSGQGFYSGNYDAERIVQEVTSGDQPSLDLRSDKAYKEFLIEQSELVLAEKSRIFEESGLSAQVNRALELRDEQQSVHVLSQVHPLCFLSAQERLLRGIDALNSPLGKIMAHLSQMYRKLNVPDMRAYVDYYTEQLDAAGLFDTFPAIRERLINYRNSLIDPPPELLKQVHLGLLQIEDDSKGDHRRCVELQVGFLHSCLRSEVFARVWPTIAVILENLVGSELQSLGEQRPQAFSWRGRLDAEERSQPRSMPAILEDVEPASSESLGLIRTLEVVQGERPGFLSGRTGNPDADGKRIEESLDNLFAGDPQAALELSGDILNDPAYSLVEKEAVHSALSRQSLADASELSHFQQTVRFSGRLAEQRECAQSFRGGLSLALVDSKISAIDLEQAQDRSMSLLHEFLRSKDREVQSRMFPEIQRSPHIPEAMKSLFRKGSDAGVVEKAMEGITTSNLSNANKLKLLGLLKKMAVHRKWLTPLTEEKLNRKILFYERILAADQKRMEELAARKSFYTSRREEIRKALLGHNARSIYAMETGEAPVSKSRVPGVQGPLEEKTHEEMHRPGFSDEFLDGLIQNRLRAARWYGKLPEHSREDLHKQAAVPGKAQVLVNQIQKDNAFKKALRHLQPPVDPAVLQKVSLQFPEPEYQASLSKFRKPPSRTPSPPNASKPAPPTSGPDAKFDKLLDDALLSGPDLPPIVAEPIEMPELPHAPARASAHTPRVQHAHAEPAHESSSHAAAVSRPSAAPQQAHAHPAAHPHPAAPPHEHRPSKSGVDGVAASLARGFSSLFGKSTSSQKPAEKAASGAPALSSKAREKKSGAKKAKEAAATLMKGISVYSKGEVFLSEKDLKSLEKDMEKHPDSRRLIEDHAYLFKLDHPDAAQFQPPIFVVIPALKACNHDQAKKKLEMGKIEKAISSAPAKKKPHLQALLTFMERYKTK